MKDKLSKNKAIFQIPRYLSILGSDFIFSILILIIGFSPLIMMYILVTFISNGPFITLIIALISFIYLIIISILFSFSLQLISTSKAAPGWIWLYKLLNYPVRQWILKNVKCPKCGGKLISPEKYKIYHRFFHYLYICSSCKQRFEIEKYKKLKRTWILKEKEFRRSK